MAPKRFTFGGETNAWWETANITVNLDRQWLGLKGWISKRKGLRSRTTKKVLDEEAKLKLL
jgi:hypothetical protein